MKTLHFRKFYDASRFEEQVTMYLQEETGEKYIVTELILEKYEAGKTTHIRTLNEFNIKIDEQELKRISKEIYEDKSEATLYLKGSLEATKKHLDDMRELVFMEGKKCNNKV